MFNVRVEYDPRPIKHIAVQCPECKNWFDGYDITENALYNAVDINFAEFTCPVCGKEFGGVQHRDKPNIEEVGYPKVYEGCLKQKTVWE